MNRLLCRKKAHTPVAHMFLDANASVIPKHGVVQGDGQGGDGLSQRVNDHAVVERRTDEDGKTDVASNRGDERVDRNRPILR